MRRSVRRVALLACVVLMTAGAAASPGFWSAATQADFLRGDLVNLAIDEHGRLTLGPSLRRLHDASTPSVWAVLSLGDVTYLATGHDGKILRVAEDGRASVFYDSGELEVHALAPAPDKGLYVATSPDGRIYHVDAQGRARTFFDPAEKYIWSLVVDTQGAVYAGTGDGGTVYRITRDGQGTAFFASKATHAISLALDTSGHVLVGTGSPGRVFRVDARGRGFLLLDTGLQEVRALHFDRHGTLFAAAQSSRAAASSGAADTPAPLVDTPAPQPSVSVSSEVTSFAILDAGASAQSAPASTAPDRRALSGAVYRVLPNGLWDELWQSRDDAPYDVTATADDAVLVATGPKGKIFRLAGEPMQPTLLARVDAQQAVAFGVRGTDVLVATANPGTLVAIAGGRSERGSYESEVMDARGVASWGTLTWRAATPAGSRVELHTRSGNTRTPDDTWSEWSPPYSSAAGSAISSPNARFLQWRAVLSASRDTPVLTSVAAAYLPRNVRPDVVSVTVHPPGVVFQKPFSSGDAEIAGFGEETPERRLAAAATNAGGGGPGLGRKTYQKGLQTIIWKAEDPHGDDLTYDVLYRREGDTSWRPLKRGLSETIVVWDTVSAPNGSYVVKVVASDSRAHPAETALTGARESDSFEVDNAPPAVVITSSRTNGKETLVSFDVRDGDTAVTRVEYSVDAEPWQRAFSEDGILDNRHERFTLRLPAGMSGRTLVVRAADAMNNIGSAESRIK